MSKKFTAEEEEYIDAVCRILDRMPDSLQLIVLDAQLIISKPKTVGSSILSRIKTIAFTPEYLEEHQYFRSQILDA